MRLIITGGPHDALTRFQACRGTGRGSVPPDASRTTPRRFPGGPAVPPRPAAAPHGAAWLRSPVGLGHAAAVLLGVIAAVDLFALWADIRPRCDDVPAAVAERGRRGAGRPRGLAHGRPASRQCSALAAVVVFLIWLWRVRRNAEVFAPVGHEGAGLGGRGLVRADGEPVVPAPDHAGHLGRERPGAEPGGHALVNVWWTLWIISRPSGGVLYTAFRKADTSQEIRTAVGR